VCFISPLFTFCDLHLDLYNILKLKAVTRRARNRFAIDIVATWTKFHCVSQRSKKNFDAPRSISTIRPPPLTEPWSTYVPVYYRFAQPRSQLPPRLPSLPSCAPFYRTHNSGNRRRKSLQSGAYESDHNVCNVSYNGDVIGKAWHT